MNNLSRVFLKSLWPVWLYCLVVPLPALLFWHSHNGRSIALCCFFLSSTSLVVYAFRADLTHTTESPVEFEHPKAVWHSRMLLLGLALLFQWIVFSLICLAFNDAHDFVAPVLALCSLVPSLCIAPYLTLTTRKPFVAVVLTLFLVGCMKLLAGSVTVLVYGWDASAHGYTTLTWTQPNLITCTLIVATAVLSTVFYFLSMRRFHSIYTVAPCYDRAA
jgi:hypothetical protein